MKNSMITLKKINDLLILSIDNKIYTRQGITQEEFEEVEILIEVLKLPEIYKKDYDKAMEDLLDIVEPSRVLRRKIERETKERYVKQLEIDFDPKERKRKAIRIEAIPGGLFEYDEEGFTYLKGFKEPMPKTLADALLDAHYNPNSKYTINSLINFWKYLLLNPDRHIRNELFSWIKNSTFALTEEGNIIAYRDVCLKRQNSKKLFNFVLNQYTALKMFNKNVNKYSVIELGKDNFSIVHKAPKNHFDNKGTIKELYYELLASSGRAIYTDNYTQSMTIEIGEPVSIPRSECDNSSDNSCSRGLHSKSSTHSMNFGEHSLVVLVNPYNVVAVPRYDNTKFRCCEYLPVSKAKVERGKIIEFDPGTYDISYKNLSKIISLNEFSSLKELQENGLINSDITSDDFNFILEEAKKAISNRLI